MNPLEYLIANLAPHICVSCKNEGSPLCLSCMKTDIMVPYLRCYRCNVPTPKSYTCTDCSHATGISSLWVNAAYAGFAKDLTKQLKFHRVKAAAQVMALWIDLQMPHLPPNTIICPVPTASKRVRARGYDQASLIAKGFAKRRNLPYLQPLARITATQQVGANRHDRFEQIRGAFAVYKPKNIVGKHILLVDDVLTTGSTLESAASTLYQYDVRRIDALTFAYQPTKEEAFPSNTKTLLV